jgi:DNA replication protein DnaC
VRRLNLAGIDPTLTISPATELWTQTRSAYSPALLDLVRQTPPTADLLRMLERIEQFPNWETNRLAHGEHLRITGLLARAELRDTIQRERPPGCWCLGAGGGDYIPTPEGGRFAEYCPACPEGEQAARRFAQQASRERQAQEAQRSAAQISESMIPVPLQRYRLETFPAWALARGPRLQAVHQLLSYWCEQHASPIPATPALVLEGTQGVGKTGLAVGLLYECQRVFRLAPRFVDVPALLGAIKHSYHTSDGDDEEELLAPLFAAGIVLLDDVGAEGSETAWSARTLARVINHRLTNGRTTILTTNLATSQQHESELGEWIGKRTYERLIEATERTYLLHVRGPNLRLGPDEPYTEG